MVSTSNRDTLALAVGGPDREVRFLGQMPHDVPKLVRRIQELGEVGSVQVAYEAGPTGYDLYRARLDHQGRQSPRAMKLIESAWSGRFRPALSIKMRRRQIGVPRGVCDIAWAAQKRLHERYWAMTSRGKRPQTAVVAMARELVGFIWAVGQVVPEPAG